MVNRFRVKTLGLEPVSTLWAPGQLFRLKVPYTYMWSPGLIPKPADWGPEIDIAGFVFLDLASAYKPPESLSKFLEAGKPPVYIGFGSIVVEDPDEFTTLIFEAVKQAGVRALVSKGWGGLGSEDTTPDDVFMLENTPHDWLFPRVSAVVHHGGAGTTAIGLKCGKPTMIVPFFGDQPFWGAMVSKAGAGAHQVIPYKRLTADALAEGIQQCLSPEARVAAEKIAQGIAEEGDGAKNAVDSFHRHLPRKGEPSMRCSVLPERVAVWSLKGLNLRLSALAAELLVGKRKIKWRDLRLVRHHEWNDFEGPGEPITGVGAALMHSTTGIVTGMGSMPVKWAKSIRKREKQARHARKEKERKSSQSPRKSTDTGDASRMNGTSTGHGEDTAKLSHGAQHGAEKHLSEPHTSLQRAESDLNNHGSFQSYELKTLSADDQRGDNDENAFTDVSDASGDHLASNLAEDTGAGIVNAGEALAKGLVHHPLLIAM